MLAGRKEKYLIAWFDHRVAIRPNRPVVAKNRNDTGIDIGNMVTQFPNRMSHQRTPGIGTHCDQADPAARKLKNLQGLRKFNQFGDRFGHGLFGTDHVVHRESTLPQQIRVGIEIGRTYPSDAQRQIEQPRCDLARHQISLVHRGHRDQHVRVFGTRGQQGTGQQAVAGNHLHIESFAQLRQTRGILIDDRNVIVLRSETLSHGLADPASTQDNDLHAVIIGSSSDVHRCCAHSAVPIKRSDAMHLGSDRFPIV